MKTRSIRSLTAAFMLMCLLAINCTVCAAATSVPEIQPRYTGVTGLSASLEINKSGAASCYASVNTMSGYSGDFVVELQRDGDTIKTWKASGSGYLSIDKVYYVTSGHDYQVIATVTVKNSAGNIVDTPSSRSDIRSY